MLLVSMSPIQPLSCYLQQTLDIVTASTAVDPSAVSIMHEIQLGRWQFPSVSSCAGAPSAAQSGHESRDRLKNLLVKVASDSACKWSYSAFGQVSAKHRKRRWEAWLM